MFTVLHKDAALGAPALLLEAACAAWVPLQSVPGLVDSARRHDPGLLDLMDSHLIPTQERLVFEASQLKGCTITTFPDQNKILPLLGFLPTAADPPDEVWSQVREQLHSVTSHCSWRCSYLMPA